MTVPGRVILFFLPFFLIILFSDSGTHALPKNYRIGVSLPLSGDFSTLGNQYLAGMKLAMNLLPEAKEVRLVISDDGCKKNLAELAIDRIRNANVMLVTGFLCNDPVHIAANLLHNRSIPILVSAARSSRILQDRTRYGWNVWQLAPSDTDIDQAAFRVLAKRWKSTPYAIVNDGTAYSRIRSDTFRMLMEEADNKPKTVEVFHPNQPTQENLIHRLLKAGIKAAYLVADASDIALIGHEATKLGVDIELASDEALSLLPYIIEDSRNIPKGLLAIMPPFPENIPAVRSLVKKIEAAGLESSPYLLLGYATMQIVSDYLNGTEKKFINRKFSTILGNVEFSAQGKNITNQYHLYQWNGKKFSMVK